MTVTEALAAAVQERYRVLRLARVISRKTPDSPAVVLIDAELRALVRLRWHARRTARKPVSAYPPGSSYHDVQAEWPADMTFDRLPV